jgi:hypothetical protein
LVYLFHFISYRSKKVKRKDLWQHT